MLRSVPERSVILTTEANADLASILLYTANQWGMRQRDVYAEHIAVVLQEWTRYPELGRLRADISPGLRIRVVQQHVIYYRADDNAVTVVRIVHSKMDARTLFDQ